MEEWKEYKLGEVAVFSQGIQVGIEKQAETCKEGYVRFIRIVDYTKGTDEPRYIQHPGSKYMVDETDLVMMRYGTPGKVARGYRGAIANNMFKISINENILNKDYTFYYLSQDSVYRTLIASNSSSTMPAINFKIVERLEIIAPSLSNQRRIASILSSLDDKIELNRKINANLEAQAQALFKSWFVDFEPFKDQPFVESELGMIPEGWRVGNIYEYIDVIYGAPYKSSLFNENKDGLPLIRIRDLKTNAPQFYTPELLPNTEYINAGDILAGMDAEFIPYVWLGEKGVLNQRCCKFKGKNDAISNYYILFLIKPELEYVQSYKTGTTVSHLGKSDIDRFRFITPPLDVVLAFSERVNPMKEEVVNRAKESRRLASLRDALLPRLMSGELKVNEIVL